MSKLRYRLFSSLRFRLVLLVLLAILPAVGVVWHSSLEQRQHVATLEKEEALRLAHLMSHNYSHIIEGARHFLYVVAQLPTLRTCEPTSCHLLFSDLLKQYPWYLNIGAAHPDGNVFASAISMVKPVNIADRSYFQMALQTHKFSIGDYQIGRVVGKPVVNFGYPVLDDARKVKAIVYVAMDLDWLNKLSARANLPPGSTVKVVNHNGMILAHHPHPEKWIGKTDSEIPVIEAILSQREGTIEAMGKDGVQRFYAFTPFGGTDQAGDIYVSVGLPAQVALAQLAKVSTRSLILLGLICLLAIVAAMVGGKLLILRGLDPLVKAAKRLGAGDLSARTGIVYGKGELSQLAITFDEMAGSLEQRESGRKKDEDALRLSQENASRLAQEKAIIAEIGRTISSTVNIEEVYERFVEETRRLIPFDRISINLLDPKNDKIKVVYLSGVDVEGRRAGDLYPLHGTASEEVMRSRVSLIIHAEAEEDFATRFPRFFPHFQAGLRSMMLVPLISRDVVFGILHLQSKRKNAYHDQDCRLTENIANQIAGAIANAQLYNERKRAEEAVRKSEEETKRFAQENAVVAEIGRIISSTLNIEEVYERFSEEVTKLIPVDRTAFTIINPKDRTATTAYASGVEIQTRLPGEAFPLAGSGTEMAERAKAGLIIPTEDENEVATQVPGLLPVFKAGIRSVMMIPLVSRDRVIGVLNLQSTKPKAYTEKELRIGERVGFQIAGAIANTQLFSEHKRAEEALQESEIRFRDLYDNAPLGYHEYDHEGRITNVNRRDLEMLGYTAEEMIGEFMWKFNVEEEIAQQQILEKLAGTRPPGRNLERTYRRKDGTTFPVLIEDRLIPDGKGRIKGIRCTIQDITDRKRAEKEMAALQEQLHQSQKMEAIGCLAGGISHDFNNLLSIIIPYCQMALLDLKEIDPLRDTVEKIHKAGQRAADLTRQLLAFSRRQMMEMKVLDLNALLTDLNKMLHRLIGEDIELVYEFAADLGRVKADTGQIEQIVLNLAVNARDAMPEGGKLTIETANVELDEKYAKDHFDVNPGPFVMLMVSDTGVGMTPEIRERIFEPFFTTKEKGRGTGLGLAVVYGIVKQSGGFIHVYSESGMGTTFRIYFPRVEGRLEESKTESRKELLRGGETVLVVEDEEEVRKLAVTILQKQGYKVLEAGSGGEAILFGEGHENPIHLMVTDVVLPGMGGRVLAERLSPLHPGMKVLYMSGYTYNSIGHHGILEEGVHFIQKPFTLEGFTRKIREVLDQPEREVFS